jgi:hypothetical protein
MQEEIARVYDAHFRYEGVARHIQSKLSAVRTRGDAVALTAARKDFAF